MFCDSSLNKYHNTELNCKRELKSLLAYLTMPSNPFSFTTTLAPTLKERSSESAIFSLLPKGLGMELLPHYCHSSVPPDMERGHAYDRGARTSINFQHSMFTFTQSWTALEWKLALVCWTIQSHQNNKMFYYFLSSLASRASPSVASRASPSVVVLSADLLPDSRSSAI